MQLSVDDFARVLPKCRSKETSWDPANRSDKNPSYRQCLATALLANEVLEFDVYAEKWLLENGYEWFHFFNKDKQNISIRFCEEQFTFTKVLKKKQEKPITKWWIDVLLDISPESKQRYEILKEKFQKEIQIAFR